MSTLLERFEAKYIPEPNSGCWLWLGGDKVRGYGGISMFGKMEFAHRVSYWLFNGAIPDGHIVRHTCDNPSCVNPAHLTTGTMLDNSRDMVERGRHNNGGGNIGTDNGSAKLTDEQVREIKHRLKHGAVGRQLAFEYGIDPAMIYNIKSGKNWRHI